MTRLAVWLDSLPRATFRVLVAVITLLSFAAAFALVAAIR